MSGAVSATEDPLCSQIYPPFQETTDPAAEELKFPLIHAVCSRRVAPEGVSHTASTQGGRLRDHQRSLWREFGSNYARQSRRALQRGGRRFRAPSRSYARKRRSRCGKKVRTLTSSQTETRTVFSHHHGLQVCKRKEDCLRGPAQAPYHKRGHPGLCVDRNVSTCCYVFSLQSSTPACYH